MIHQLSMTRALTTWLTKTKWTIEHHKRRSKETGVRQGETTNGGGRAASSRGRRRVCLQRVVDDKTTRPTARKEPAPTSGRAQTAPSALAGARGRRRARRSAHSLAGQSELLSPSPMHHAPSGSAASPSRRRRRLRVQRAHVTRDPTSRAAAEPSGGCGKAGCYSHIACTRAQPPSPRAACAPAEFRAATLTRACPSAGHPVHAPPSRTWHHDE